jgi:hypothetical protein
VWLVRNSLPVATGPVTGRWVNALAPNNGVRRRGLSLPSSRSRAKPTTDKYCGRGELVEQVIAQCSRTAAAGIGERAGWTAVVDVDRPVPTRIRWRRPDRPCVGPD